MPAARVSPRAATVDSPGAPRPRGVSPVGLDELAARIDAAPAGTAAVPGRLGEVADGGFTGRRPTVTGITLRAADVRPGDLFAALPGTRHHGADFAAAAVAAGAVAVLTDPAGAGRAIGVPVLVHPRPRDVLGAASAYVYGDPTAALTVIGITGTSGKTTVAHLVEAGLAAAGRTTGLLGTVRTRIAGELLPSALTTPEAPDLQAMFAVMAQAGVTDVAMEVSSHALALGRVSGTRFAVGAFTNLSQDHLDFHPDMDEYFATKARLFGPGGARDAVICVDDEWGRRLATQVPGAATVATGPVEQARPRRERSGGGRGERTVDTGGERAAGRLGEPAGVRWSAADVRTGPDGTQTFTARAGDRPSVLVRLLLPGAFNVANALVALACLDRAGIPADVAAPAFAQVTVPGRMQRVDAGQPFLAVVDYAHKPAAVAAMLDALRAQVPGRLLVVLGCGGERDAAKRPLMGAAAASRAELLVVTDDNPRGEDPAVIRAAMLAGARAASGAGEVLEVGDRQAAIAAAVGRARPGDAVVVAGKGHESGQEIGGVRHPFDDTDVLRAIISASVGATSERTT